MTAAAVLVLTIPPVPVVTAATGTTGATAGTAGTAATAATIAVGASAGTGRTAGTGVTAAVGECAMNGGFEEPGGLRGQENRLRGVLGWHTSSRDGLVELWGPGNRAAPMNFTVPADTGDQFAELNGTSAATLYQDVPTTPGSTLSWSLAHRGRTRSPNSKDIMVVRIGGITQIPDGRDRPGIADGNDAWGHYRGSYRVPRGQRSTRVEFIPNSSGTALPGYGNFLDSVSISCTSPSEEGNQPPGMPYLVLSGPAGSSLDGSLASTDPEGGTVTYVVGVPEPWVDVRVRANGAVTARPVSPGLYQVPVKACDDRGACGEGRIVVVAYRRTGPAARPTIRPTAGPAIRPTTRSTARPAIRPAARPAVGG
ncbi:hypothetical protein ACQPYK_45430 [Streptosporangium sp. CA-135522]|uniref:hypothetical protein n=1 Tax=Streptosporangium sp. CA-135522 TaxID=3240072 RepID=UPI003D93981E